MRIHYFTMNLYGSMVAAGGVGLVAVDLLHKKEKIAKEMIDYFISYFKENGASIVLLYPFRPDFYKQMGFGYGTKMNHYNIEPSSFPKVLKKAGLTFLNASHKELIMNCVNKYAKANHGMILKTENDVEVMFKNPDHKIVGFIENDILQGYLLFTFKNVSRDNFLINHLIIKEFIYESPQALAQLCGFLNSQADQFDRIVLNTQDDDIEYLISDPRNGSNHLIPSVYHETKTSGIGLMYKIINIEAFFKQLPSSHFSDLTCEISLIIHDTFQSNQPQKWLLSLEKGGLSIEENDQHETEIEMELDIADFSSLAMGTIDIHKLFQYGKVKISKPEYVTIIKKLFNHVQKPICTTSF